MRRATVVTGYLGAMERGSDAGWTILEVLLVVFLVGALLALALPNLHTTRIRNNEAAAAKTLGELVAAQEMVRKAALVDADGDGRGEYAFLQEISGERNPRTFTPPPGGGGPTAPLPQFRNTVLENGEAEICGYRVRIWLPGKGGRAVGETRAGPSGDPDPALARSIWCAYAWPVRREGDASVATGKRTFFVNQAGEVLSAEAAYAALPAGEGKPPAPPPPGAAFQGAGGAMEAITGAPAIGTVGRDGNAWRAVR